MLLTITMHNNTWCLFIFRGHSTREPASIVCDYELVDLSYSAVSVDKVNGQKLETVTSFKYLGSVVTDKGSKPEILSWMLQTTAAETRLKDRIISVGSKI